MAASANHRWLALALLSVVQFMIVLDIAIVNVALPSIQVDLGFSQENLQWVISAYALVFGGFLLLGGRTADIVGRRKLFIVGLGVFSVASLLAALAWNEPSLIGARAFQGLGAAIIAPAALSILMTTFTEGRERNIALGVWGAVGGFGAAAGVLMGGVFTDALSWEWIFYVNIPVGLAAIALAPVLLAESRDAAAASFDAPGGLLVTSGLVAAVFGIIRPHSRARARPGRALVVLAHSRYTLSGKVCNVARMRRINIVIDPELDDRLEREAHVRGMSKSALVRQCVDQELTTKDVDNGLRRIGAISYLFDDVEPVDIDTELYGPLEADS